MFLQSNKKLLIGAAATLAVWLIVYYGFIQSKWTAADDARTETKAAKDAWDELYKAKDDMVPKPDAEKAIDESNRKIRDNMVLLRTIEFGNEMLLKTYTESTAGSEDHKNYVIKLRKTLVDRTQSMGIKVTPPDLGFVSKNADEPVSVNLIRLAMMDRFLTNCADAGLNNKARVTKISYGNPSAIALPESAADARTDASFSEEAPRAGKKGAAAPAEKPVASDRLVQFPLIISLELPEPAVGQLLYEIQKPTSDGLHSYFSLRGIRIVVHDNSISTGLVEAELIVSALLNEEICTKLAIQWQRKDKDDRKGSRTSDEGYGDIPDR
jgi:hypothetical protein